MKIGEISSKDFLAGNFLPQPRAGRGIHNFKAEWVEGRGIRINGHIPHELKISFASTNDMRTCYAYCEGVGFIGGWQYPHRKMPFKYLVESINQGILYYDQNSLPNGRRRS